MASTPVEIQAPAGLALTLNVYDAAGAIVNTGGDTLTEGVPGFYAAIVAEATPTAAYRYAALEGSTVRGTGHLPMRDDLATYRGEESHALALQALQGSGTPGANVTRAANDDTPITLRVTAGTAPTAERSSDGGATWTATTGALGPEIIANGGTYRELGFESADRRGAGLLTLYRTVTGGVFGAAVALIETASVATAAELAKVPKLGDATRVTYSAPASGDVPPAVTITTTTP